MESGAAKDSKGEDPHGSAARATRPAFAGRAPPAFWRNPLSFLTLWWFSPILMTGNQRQLQEDDLFAIPADVRTECTLARFDQELSRRKAALLVKGDSSMQKTEEGKSGALLVSSIISLHWQRLVVALTMQVAQAFFTFWGPIFLRRIVNFLSDYSRGEDVDVQKAYVNVALMSGAPVASALCWLVANVVAIGTQMKIRSELTASVYRKSLRLSNAARGSIDTGRVVNLMSTDITNIINLFFPFLNIIISAPLTIIGALIMLWFQIRWATFIGLAVLLVSGPAVGVFIAQLTRFRAQMLKVTDRRVKLVNQLLSGIRVLKMYAWEEAYQGHVLDAREDELQWLRRCIPARIAMQTLLFTAPLFASVASFSIYSLAEPERITTGRIFSSIAYFSLIRFPLVFLPFAFVQMGSALVSMRRISQFLVMEERKEQVVKMAEPGIKIKGGCFTWPASKSADGGGDSGSAAPLQDGKGAVGAELQPAAKGQEAEGEESEGDAPTKQFRLRNVSLEVAEGELVCVVGRVGSGKSSLVNALLGEMDLEAGTVQLGGRVAYVAQQPWIVNCTVRENITFGRDFDKALWQTVVHACSLETDLAILPAAEDTEIGEKGINLSGGQRQRVSLARALYQDAQVYIMDDPLSAVDVHVGRHIFTECITGALKGKTRLLVTNQLQYLSEADRIFYVEDGCLAAQGTLAEVSENEQFARLLAEFNSNSLSRDASDLDSGSGASDSPKAAAVCEPQPQPLPPPPALLTVDGPRGCAPCSSAAALDSHAAGKAAAAAAEEQEEQGGDVLGALKPSPSQQAASRELLGAGSFKFKSKSRHSMGAAALQQTEAQPELKRKPTMAPGSGNVRLEAKKDQGQLVAAEDRAQGQVKTKVYGKFGKAYGLVLLLGLTCCWCGEQSVRILTNWWLSRWTDAEVSAKIDDESVDRALYLGVYLAFAFGFSLLIVARSCVNLVGSLRAAMRVHSDALQGVVRSPVVFFDTTPIGRILNRFSKDMDDLDFFLPQSITEFGNCIMQLAATFIFLAILQPWFLVGAAPLAVCYFLLQRFYRRSSIELQRLDAVSRSPIYAHFSETISGLDTLRAYSLEEQFAARSDRAVDKNHRAYMCEKFASEWLAVRLECIGAAIIFITSILAVVNRGDLSAGLIALALTEALDVTQFLKHAVKAAATMEARFNAVERLQEFGELESEAPRRIDSAHPPDTWPSAGVVEYRDLWMRYRSNLDPVLRGVSFVVEGGEKVGIVGRTGSGKSSLIVSLFRLTEPFQGDILVDGRSILQMGLNDVRSRVAAIPQEPLLFSGSVRSNLDPFDRHTDPELWAALESVRLKEVVAAMEGGLQSGVTEGGENFSVGQRQLLCVARAILRKPKILVADEATASVDSETDSLIQRTLRSSFQDCTMLTIAHRLNTILDSDKVLVMDGGRVRELDNVANLMAQPESLLRGMVIGAGIDGSWDL